MKKLIILGIMVVWSLQSALLAQDQKLVDSLESVLKNSKQDTSRITILQKLYHQYIYNDSTKAMDYALQALDVAQQAGYPKGTAEAYNNLGVVYNTYGNTGEALDYFNKALVLFESLGDKYNAAGTNLNIGNINFNHGNLPEAMKYFTIALKMFEEIGDQKGVAMSNLNIGYVYQRQGNMSEAFNSKNKALKIYEEMRDSLKIALVWKELGSITLIMGLYPETLKYYLDALKILEIKGSKRSLSTLYNDLGALYVYLDNNQEAMRYYALAVDLANKAGLKSTLATILDGMAIIFAEEGNTREAINTYHSALKIYEEIGFRSGIANIYMNLGFEYWEQKEYDQALDYCQKSITLYEEIGEKTFISTAYNNLGRIYIDQKKYAEASVQVHKALENALASGYLDQVSDSYELLTKLDSARGDHKAALEHYKLYTDAQDSLMNEESIKKITGQQMQFEFDKKEALAKADQEKKDAIMHEEIRRQMIQKRLYLISGLSVLALALLLFHIFRLRVRKKRIIADQKIRQLEEEKKLLAARFLVEGEEKERKRIAQELHDGLGVLLSVTKMQFSQIKSSSPETSPLIEKATKFLDQASKDVRRISHNMMPGLLTKMGLFEALEDLFEQISDTDKIEAVCEILGNKERLPENKEIMLYRIIQEMVHNTMKYAEATKIELQMESLTDQVRFRYSDNGKGFSPDDASIKGSLGLQSIRSRVKFLDGKVSLESEAGNGTQYRVEVPL